MIVCRYLGRACVEIISTNDHLIIDPNYVEPPRKGINKVLLTHEHEDHLDPEKIQKIYEEYIRENQDFEIYGSNSTKNKVAIEEPYIVDDDTVINLNDGEIEVFTIDCWGTDSCVGYLINIDGKRILHTADSANYSERLKAIEKDIDCCFVACFEDYYKDYLDFIKTVKPKLTIPYHFGPDEKEMGIDLAKYLDENDVNVKFLNPGEEIEI
jgi:L-ascorbate metabolism protein UlaG (beta-lactamase superfamily)